jgi:hypothetical protein
MVACHFCGTREPLGPVVALDYRVLAVCYGFPIGWLPHIYQGCLVGATKAKAKAKHKATRSKYSERSGAEVYPRLTT